MTVLVGVRCVDGVVIGADSAATSTAGNRPIIQLESNNKIRVAGNAIVACTGAVGFSQRLDHHLDAAIRGNQFAANQDIHAAKNALPKRLLTDFQSTMVQSSAHQGLGFGALMGVALNDTPYLIEYGTVDFQPEIKEGKLFFASMGSGQPLADPFLAFVSRVLWQNEMPTVDMAKIGLFWALDHTIKLAPGSVGAPVHLAVLQKANDNWETQELLDTQEAAQHVEELERYISSFAVSGIAEAESEPPPVPPNKPGD